MQEQQELIEHEIPEDALAADVAQLGGPYVVGKKLRPELSKESARNWLLNCLNPNHAQNLHLSQIRLLMNLAREVGSFHTVHFWEKDNHMTQSTPIQPEDELAKLQREFIKSVGILEKTAGRIEELTSPRLKVAR